MGKCIQEYAEGQLELAMHVVRWSTLRKFALSYKEVLAVDLCIWSHQPPHHQSSFLEEPRLLLVELLEEDVLVVEDMLRWVGYSHIYML